MAKDEKTDDAADDAQDDDAGTQIDPAAIIKSAVDEAMTDWWKKNRPAPSRTARPEGNTLFNTLFGTYK